MVVVVVVVVLDIVDVIVVVAVVVVQANLRKFLELIQNQQVDKVSRLLERGLDPNYQDADTGGESLTPPTGPPRAWF